MPTTSSTSWPRAFALAAAGAGTAAAGLLAPDLRWAAAGLAVVWAGAAWRAHGGGAGLAPLLPALALVIGDWWALAPWTLLAVVSARFGELLRPDPERARAALDALHDAERERDSLQAHISRYPVLLEACLELSGARDLDQLAAGLCARARAIAPGLDTVRVFLGAGGEPSCRASADAQGRPCPRPPGEDERYVAAESRALALRDGDGLRVLLPLRGDRRRGEHADGGLRGVLEARFSDAGEPLARELLAALARLGGLGLAAVDLLAQARSLALRDELTGLFGQHEFLRRLDEQVASGRRNQHAVGVLMCDMDHLKAFNDRWGHPAGDAALRAVAAALRATVPAEAIPCRYGGEEFAVIVPDATAEGLATLAERLRAAIAASVPDPAHPERRVTASLGWAMVGEDEAGRAALARADAACYAAKKGGRNRVEAAA